MKVQKDKSREELICESSQLRKRVIELEELQTQRESFGILREEADRQVRDILESITDGFISVDNDWRYVYVNQTTLKRLGKTRDEIIGHVIWDVFPDAVGSIFDLQCRDSVKDGAPRHFEYFFQPLEAWYEVHCYPSHSGLSIFFVDIKERKRVENKLYQYERIVSSTTDMLALVDKNYVYLAANAAYLKAFAKASDEVIGWTVAEVFGEEVFNTIIRPMADRCLAGEDVRYQDWFDYPAYERKFMDISYSPYLGPDSEVRGFVVVGRDITERKRAEEKLRDSLQMSDDLLRTIPSGIYIYEYEEPDKLFLVDANRAAEELTGVRLCDWKGKEFNEIWPKARELGITETYLNVARTGETSKTEDLNYKDNKLDSAYRVHSFVLPNNRLAVAFEDISVRKLAEVEISNLARFPGENPNPVLRISADGGVLYHNKASRVLLRAWRYHSGKPLPQPWRQIAMDALSSGNDRQAEVKCKDSIFSLVFAPITGSGYVNVYALDITERKRAEADLTRHVAELANLNKELETFAYSVSHDLRSPLRSVSGFSELLLDDYSDKLDAKGKDYLTRTCAACRRMEELIDALLTLSRVTRKEMAPKRVDLSTLAREIADQLSKTEPQRQVKFIIQDDLIVTGDKRLLRLALTRLLENAWKFTSKCPQARIECGTTQIEGKQVYFVRDNGVGFDSAYADKIFRAFQRLHSAKEYPGIGIGLATAQRIVKRHGGDIWAKSEVEKGATFYFTLREKAKNE